MLIEEQILGYLHYNHSKEEILHLDNKLDCSS